MNIIIKGKNMEVPEQLHSYVEKKLGKLDRYLDNINSATVELALEKTRSSEHRHTAQVTIVANGAILRGEEKADDIRKAIDAVADVMHRQITRYKEKLYSRGRGGRAEEMAQPLAESNQIEERRLVKIKQFAVKPLTVDEAIEHMELLGHDFFVFYNPHTEQVNVIYRRWNGDYGLIEPELE